MTLKTVHTLQYYSILSYTLQYNTLPYYPNLYHTMLSYPILLHLTTHIDFNIWLRERRNKIFTNRTLTPLCPEKPSLKIRQHLEIDAKSSATTFLLSQGRPNDSEVVSFHPCRLTWFTKKISPCSPLGDSEPNLEMFPSFSFGEARVEKPPPPTQGFDDLKVLKPWINIPSPPLDDIIQYVSIDDIYLLKPKSTMNCQNMVNLHQLLEMIVCPFFSVSQHEFFTKVHERKWPRSAVASHPILKAVVWHASAFG